MNKLLLTAMTVLLAAPALAQEVDLIGPAGIGDLLDIPAPRGAAPARGAAPPARGAAPRGAAPNAPPVDRLVRLRELLGQANSPLTKEQETGLNGLINSEIPLMRQALQRKAMQIAALKGGGNGMGVPAAPGAPSASGAPAPPQPTAPGQRGPNPTAAMLSNVTSDDIAPEIIRLNDQLLGKIADATMLLPPQQAVVKKIYKDQIKAHGGFEAIKMAMDDGSVPFTAEQAAQIQPLFEEKDKLRLQLAKEAAGQPVDKGKLDQLDRDTLAKVLKLLTPAQRTALLQPKPNE